MKDRFKKSITIFMALLLCSAIFCACNNTELPSQTEVSIEAQTVESETAEISLLEINESKKEQPIICGTLFAIDNVNIRKEPSTESEIIDLLSIGDKIDYIRILNEEWTEVYYFGQTCYIASQYLTEDPDWEKHLLSKNGYSDGELIGLNSSWRYADFSEINSGNAIMYLSKRNRKNIIIGINAGHGTKGGTDVKTWCHPDQTEKVTGGTTAAGAKKAVAVSIGMNFADGTPESKVTLKEAKIVKEMLLNKGYDVLMIRESEDVQLDNVARTVICNNVADCHIAIHWDGDGLNYDKGCFYMSVPDGIKYLDSVSSVWQESERLGDCLISGLRNNDNNIMGDGKMDMDLTQTSYSTVPSIDIELGNQSSDYCDDNLRKLAVGIVDGVDMYFSQ